MGPLRPRTSRSAISLFLLTLFITLGAFSSTAGAQAIDCASQSSGFHFVSSSPATECGSNTPQCPSGQQRFVEHQYSFTCDGGSNHTAPCTSLCPDCRFAPVAPASFPACEGQYTDANGSNLNILPGSCSRDTHIHCDGITKAKCGDCPFYVKTVGGEICGDGVDNDKDGRVDEGCGGSQGGPCVGSPIHLATGNMFLKHTDFSLRTGTLPIHFSRTYKAIP